MLLENNNLVPFLFTFLPALFYAFMIFLAFPKNTVTPKISFLHFLMGSITVTAVSAFQWIFPNWGQQMFCDFLPSILAMAFFQVAFLEESVKLLFYRFTEMYRGKLPNPISAMFYMMCVSTGFAVVENMMYAWVYGEFVLGIRAFSAIILHMLAGLIMGYFIALGMYNRKKSRIRSIMYRMVGLLSATFIHGLYDFNIMIAFIEYPTREGIINIPTGYGINSWWVLGPGTICALIMLMHLRRIRGRKRASLPSSK